MPEANREINTFYDKGSKLGVRSAFEHVTGKLATLLDVETYRNRLAKAIESLDLRTAFKQGFNTSFQQKTAELEHKAVGLEKKSDVGHGYADLNAPDTRFANKRPSEWSNDYNTKHFKDRPEHSSAIPNHGYTTLTTTSGEQQLTHKQVMEMHHRIDAENKLSDKVSKEGKLKDKDDHGMSK